MSLKVVSVKLTGTPDKKGWAQIHDFVPEDQVKLAKRGHLFAVIATSDGEEGVDSVFMGREIISRLHEEFFGSLKDSVFKCLKEAVKKTQDEFYPLWKNLEIGAASVLDGIVYCAAVGGASIFLYREGNLNRILESGKECISASGRVKEDDILLIGTKNFFTTFTKGTIRATLAGGDLTRMVEQLAPGMRMGGEGAKAGAVFLKFLKTQTDLEYLTAEKLEVTKENTAQFQSEKIKTVTKPYRPKFIDNLALKSLTERILKIREGGKDSELLTRKKRVSVSVGVILAFLLIVSIGFGIRQKKLAEFKAVYVEKLSQAQHEFEESLQLASISPQRARELFVSSQETVNLLTSQGVKDEALLTLKENIEKNQGLILAEYRQEPNLFVDLSLLSSGFKGSRIVTYQDTIYVADFEGKKIVSISIASKRSEVVAGPKQIDEIKDVAVYSDKVYVLNSKGIYNVVDGSKKVIEVDWGEDVLSALFAANFYILDRQNSTIIRYAGGEEGFGPKKNWLAEGVKMDFSEASDWAIDGSIWVLTAGKIKKFSLGNPQNFVIKDVFPALERGSAIYTDEDAQYLYILDKDQSRVVVTNKEGDYKAQYLSDKMKDAGDIVVSEKEKRLIFLAQDKLFSVELEHL